MQRRHVLTALMGSAFLGASLDLSPAFGFEVSKSDAEWKKQLSPAAYNVLRHQDTEAPFTSPLNKEHRKGIFACAGCALELFSSDTKFDSGTGWPSFYRPLPNAVQTSDDHSLFMERMVAALSVAFGGLATLLAAVGLYGVMSYSVARRTREIGIRMALGATKGRVRSMILRDGMKPVVVGLAIGFIAAMALGRLLGSLLYGVSPLDPVTYGAIALLLSTVALVASAVPARRAVGGDPVEVLRTE